MQEMREPERGFAGGRGQQHVPCAKEFVLGTAFLAAIFATGPFGAQRQQSLKRRSSPPFQATGRNCPSA
jgi:hypothetical protein